MTRWGMVIDLERCTGCGSCMAACHQENNLAAVGSEQSARSRSFHWLRILREVSGNGSNVKVRFMPQLCVQCDDPPCAKVCPVHATYLSDEGIVAQIYGRCIGCRYCMAACPYDARRFNYKKPTLEASQVNPNQTYLSNRVRPKGVVEKCTFCLQRTRAGRLPACLEVCPTGARIFGNILDPESEINHVLKSKRVYVLKEDVGTRPRFYYFFD